MTKNMQLFFYNIMLIDEKLWENFQSYKAEWKTAKAQKISTSIENLSIC